MEKDTINTNSIMFKLYSARMMRECGCWDVEDVLEQPVDICSYSRNIILQVAFIFFIKFFLPVVFLLLAIFMVLTPLLTFGFWIFTDNPFVVWFGPIGKMFMLADVGVLCVGLFLLIKEGINRAYYFVRAIEPNKDSPVMSNYNIVSTWVKSAHGKFCVPLQFNRKSKLEEDDKQ